MIEPPLADSAINEDEWFDETLRSVLAAHVLRISIEKLKPKVVAPTPDLYWTELKSGISKIREDGLHPVLVLENPTLPEWVWEWMHPSTHTRTKPPIDFTARFEDGQGDAYYSTVNDVPMYSRRLTEGSSLLLALSLLIDWS